MMVTERQPGRLKLDCRLLPCPVSALQANDQAPHLRGVRVARSISGVLFAISTAMFRLSYAPYNFNVITERGMQAHKLPYHQFVSILARVVSYLPTTLPDTSRFSSTSMVRVNIEFASTSIEHSQCFKIYERSSIIV